MKSTRLAHQILIVFAAVVILALGISGWAITVLAQRIVADNVARGHQELARRIAEEIDLEMEDIRPILSLLAESSTLRSMESTGIVTELTNYQVHFPALTAVFVADLNGQQIARTDGEPLENVATTLGFQVAQEGHELVSDVYLVRQGLGPTLTIYLPITDNGTVIGVLVANVNFARVQTILENLSLTRDETIVVFASNGQVVAHSRMKELAELPALSDLVLVESLVQGPVGVLDSYTDELGRAVVGVHAPVNELDWGVVIQTPVGELASEVAALRQTMEMGLLGGVVLAVIAGWLMAHRLTKPIVQLVMATERVAGGDLTTTVDVTTSNEIGRLTDTFNQMVASIQRAQRALRESEARYRGLFEDSPISLWEEDFSAVKRHIDDLRASGITDFKTHFQDHPETVRHCAAMVRVVDVNRATLEMLQYETKEELAGNLAEIFRAESYDVFREELITLAQGKTVFEAEGVNQTRHGDEIYVSMRLAVVPGYEETWSKVFVSFTEITERVRAEEALQQHAERLRTLHQIDQAILAAQSPEAIAQAALSHIRHLMPCQRVSLATFDLETQEATVLAVRANSETRIKAGMRLSLETFGITEELLQGQVRVVEDTLNISQPSLSAQALRAEGIRSYIVVPLAAQGELIGSLNLGSEEPRAFASEYIDIACELADQLAIAIQQAHLYEQVQRHTVELEGRIAAATKEIGRRADELAVLYEVSRDLVTTLDMGILLPIIAQRVTDTLQADRCTVFLFDKESGELRARAAHGYMAERLADFSYLPGEEVVGQAYAKGEPQYVPDLEQALDLPRRDAIRAVLAVPLVSPKAGPLGALSVTSLRPDAFAPDQQQLLETMASQIAGAIENARLYQAIERHAAELTTLHEVGKHIITTLDLDTRLQTIANDTAWLVRADKSLILLIDAEREMLIKAVGHGYSSALLKQLSFEEFRDGISGWVLQEKAPTLSPDIQTDERNRGMALASARESGDRAAAVAPLIVEGDVIGTLTVINSQRKTSFSPIDLNLVTMLAGQAAIAIQNARLYEAAQEADRLKSAFLASMSHELRTPLNSIIGFTGIMLQGLAGPLNDEQTKQLGMVRDSARHLLDLINDVLDISKIEAGQLEIASEPVDMRQAIEHAVRTAIPLADKKGLALVTEIGPEVGQIVSDERRVEQILINLVNNAVKFTESGEVRVVCQVSDDWLVTRILDTGIGIKLQDMDKLFEAFRQIDTGLTRRREGTGLGLSICKKLVEMLGGEIWAKSEWGVGSTFTFTLPMKRGETGDETRNPRH